MDTLHVALVVDRSGSMERIADDMNEALGATLAALKDLDAKVIVDAWTFDHEIEHVAVGASPHTVARNLVQPRGMTALNDAIGTAIHTLLGRGIDRVSKHRKVRLVVITDGQENASTEYTRGQADALIERVKGYGWDVAFIGTESALKAEPHRTTITDSLGYVATAAGVRNMSASLASYTTTGAYGEPAVDVEEISAKDESGKAGHHWGVRGIGDIGWL